MMVRDGAALMKGGGRKKGDKRTGGGAELIAERSRRIHWQCRCETEADRRSGKADVRKEESRRE